MRRKRLEFGSSMEDKEEKMWDSLEDFAKSFSEDELKKLKEENPNLYETIMSLIWE